MGFEYEVLSTERIACISVRWVIFLCDIEEKSDDRKIIGQKRQCKKIHWRFFHEVWVLFGCKKIH